MHGRTSVSSQGRVHTGTKRLQGCPTPMVVSRQCVQAVYPLPYSPSFVPLAPQRQPSWTPQGKIEEQAMDASLVVSGVDAKPWIDAASEFSLNTDFDVSAALREKLRESALCGVPLRHNSLPFSHPRLELKERDLELKDIMQVMKDASMGKRTIQALADKLMLHRILENMNIPQMPALMTIDGHVSQAEIEQLVNTHLSGPDSQDLVIKPTHLSNGSGVIVVTRPGPEEVESTIQFITAHINEYVGQKAGAHESLALQYLKPGFIVQPKYQSVVGFKTPLELRVVVLWGRARLALWWWGRGTSPGEFPQRNAWLVRRPSVTPADCAELSEQDEWELVHDHSGSNPGFDKALQLFRRHIHAVASTAEALAVAVGAPFLRSDFFVGSAQWGVRLNEVAYGCGVDYRSCSEDNRTVDDAPLIAKIFMEGMKVCQRRLPPESFLKRLGAKGFSYADMVVTPLPAWVRPALPASVATLGDSDDRLAWECVPEDLCRTMPGSRNSRDVRMRSRSWDDGPVQKSLGLSPVSPRSSSLNRACSRHKIRLRPSGFQAMVISTD